MWLDLKGFYFICFMLEKAIDSFSPPLTTIILHHDSMSVFLAMV